MPKQKTNKAAKKRFKVTATGKVLFRAPGHRHLMSSKSAKSRRRTRKWQLMRAPHDIENVHIMLQTRPKRTSNPPPEPKEKQ
ncbi:MAG: 50S ribosomal protein L35 [Planctomycetes bacterium]|nr:50S ribosomal protein L35 [Planctomycetota bacterium]